MTKFSNLFGRLLNALAVAAALTLLAMVVMVTADILLRNLTRTGFAWSNEVSEYALYVITLLTAPWLLRRGARADRSRSDARAGAGGLADGGGRRARLRRLPRHDARGFRMSIDSAC
jgi:hypothetical protein